MPALRQALPTQLRGRTLHQSCCSSLQTASCRLCRLSQPALCTCDAHVREGSLGMPALREGLHGGGGAASAAEQLAELTQLFGLQASICWLHDL